MSRVERSTHLKKLETRKLDKEGIKKTYTYGIKKLKARLPSELYEQNHPSLSATLQKVR